MIHLGLLYLALANPPSQAATVSYSTVAAPMKRVFAELSEKTGTRLAVSNELAEEPLILDVHEVTLKDLRDRIAQAVQAEWQEDKGLLRLVRTPAKRRELEERELHDRTAALQKMLDRERRSLEGKATFDRKLALELADSVALVMTRSPGQQIDAPDNYRRIQALNDRGPLLRLMKRIVCAMDARTLARLPYEERHVFSSPPKALQMPLPADAVKAYWDFQSEWIIWSDAARERNLERFLEDRNTWEGNIMQLLKAGRGDSPPVDRIVLSFQKSWFTAGGVFQLKAADAAGKVLFEGFLPMYEDELMNRNVNPAKPPDKKGNPIEYSATTAEYLNLTKTLYSVGFDEPPQVSTELRQRLLTPETNDPLAFGASEDLMAAAKAEGRHLVAYPSDSGLEPLQTSRFGTGMSAEEAIRLISNWPETAVNRGGDWMVIRPRKPITALKLRESRSALGQYLRGVVKAGRCTVEADASYISSRSPECLNSGQLASTRLHILLPSALQTLNRSSREALWFHGSLDVGQRAALKQSRLTFGHLGVAQRRILISYMKRQEQGFQKADAPFVNQGNAHRWPAFEYNNIRKDSTEALPNGVPSSAPITEHAHRDVALRTEIAYEGREPQEATLTGLSAAEQVYWRLKLPPEETPPTESFLWLEPMFASVQTYSLWPAADLRLDLTLSDHNSAGPRVRTVKDLPADFVKAMEDMLKSAYPERFRNPPPR